MWITVVSKKTQEQVTDAFVADGVVPELEVRKEVLYAKLTRKARVMLCQNEKFVGYLMSWGNRAEITVNCGLDPWEVSAAIEIGEYTLEIINGQ